MRTRRAGMALATMLLGTVVLTTPADAKCEIGQLLTLPVTMVGLRPLVMATVDGKEARFVADSGAFFSSISPGSAAELGLRLSAAPPGLHVRGIGGEADVRVATVKQLSLGGHVFERIQFLVGGGEVGGAGLIGQNILGFADTEYDLAGGTIRLMKSHDCDHADMAYWAAGKPTSELSIVPPSEAGNHTKGTVTLDGAKIEAAFDTGADTTILTTAAAARAGVRPDSPGVRPGGYSRGLGRKLIRTYIGTFSSLTIGDEQIKKISLRFGDVSDGGFDMLIGADFFLSHRVYVDNHKHRLFFTYNGGPVFDLKTKLPGPRGEDGTSPSPAPVPGDTAAATPAAGTAAAAKPAATATGTPASGTPAMTADEYARRGATETAQRNFAAALADLDRATELAPDNPDYRYRHAVVLADSGRPVIARAEVDRALTLRPAYVDALMLRALLRYRGRDRTGARADLDAVSVAVAAPADVRLELAGRYASLGIEAAEIEQLDQWIAAHPDDARLPEALNSRCWARTLSNVMIDDAIADCSRSLRLRGHIAATIDSRGLAYLRHGDLDRAVKDFDAALAINPKLAWSLYGRGIVRTRQGDKAQGDADMAAAIAVRPDIGRMADRYGFKP